MVDAVIRWCLKNAFLVIIGVVGLLAGGYYALVNTPVDAIPDIGEKQVIVFADWPGRSPQDVDNQVTYPLTTSLTGTPGVKTIRSMSGFGFAMVFVIFKDDVDYYWARSRVLERINVAQQRLPDRRHAGARSRRHRARAGLLVYGRGRRLRPRGTAQHPGLVSALPTQRRRRRERSREHRRLREAVSDRRSPGQTARPPRLAHGRDEGRAEGEHRCGREGHREKRDRVFHPRRRLHQVGRGLGEGRDPAGERARRSR